MGGAVATDRLPEVVYVPKKDSKVIFIITQQQWLFWTRKKGSIANSTIQNTQNI